MCSFACFGCACLLEHTACLDGAFFCGFWPFAEYVELIWTLAALCPVETDELDDLVVYLAWGGTPG